MSITTWIKAAVDRLSDPRTDWAKYNRDADVKNVNEAQKKWLIKRDADWFVIYSDPTKAGSWIDVERAISWSGSSDWSSWNKMMTELEKLIKRKQEILQPTTQEEAYWRSKIKDTTPFGSVRDNVFYETSPTWNFTDKNLRELSPAEQASVRASRDAAAEAHLNKIASERKYIWEQASDTIKSLTDSINAKLELEAEKIKAAAAAAKEAWKSIFTNTDKKKIIETFDIDPEILNSMSDTDIADLYTYSNSPVITELKKSWLSDNALRAAIDGYVSDQSENALWNLVTVLESVNPRTAQNFKVWIWLEDKPKDDPISRLYRLKEKSASTTPTTTRTSIQSNPYSFNK